MAQDGSTIRAGTRASRDALIGTRIRERRTVLAIKQGDLARRVDISPSYLNLIEHNRRRIGGKLLVDIASALSVEVSALTHGAESELLDQLSEAAAASDEAEAELARIEEFVGRFPGWARLIAVQRRQIARLERQMDAMADRLSHDPALSSALHDLLSKVTAIQATATILAETGDLDRDWQEKFIANISGDSRELADRSAALAGYLDGSSEAEFALSTPQEELEAYLGRTGFHLADLEYASADTEALALEAANNFGQPETIDLARTYFARYRQDAERLPLGEVLHLVAEKGPDPQALAAAFHTDLAMAMRRLASLPSVASAASPGLLTCDTAGALSLRKPCEGFRIPRFGSACALWPLYRALGQVGRPIREWVSQPGSTEPAILTYSICAPVPPLVFDGPQAMEATMLIVPSSLLSTPEIPAAAFEVGASCRTCPVDPCGARREASVLRDAV